MILLLLISRQNLKITMQATVICLLWITSKKDSAGEWEFHWKVIFCLVILASDRIVFTYSKNTKFQTNYICDFRIYNLNLPIYTNTNYERKKIQMSHEHFHTINRCSIFRENEKYILPRLDHFSLLQYFHRARIRIFFSKLQVQFFPLLLERRKEDIKIIIFGLLNSSNLISFSVP